jgi:hypothetical protein
MKNTKSCQVFLLCDKKATTSLPHPVLGQVPACKRCAEKMARLKAATAGR